MYNLYDVIISMVGAGGLSASISLDGDVICLDDEKYYACLTHVDMRKTDYFECPMLSFIGDVRGIVGVTPQSHPKVYLKNLPMGVDVYETILHSFNGLPGDFKTLISEAWVTADICGSITPEYAKQT